MAQVVDLYRGDPRLRRYGAVSYMGVPLLGVDGAIIGQDKFARRLGRSIAPLSEPILARLRAYSWPGNVRELENVAERGVIISTRGVFDIERALPGAPRHVPEPQPTPEVANETRILSCGR